MTTSRSTAGPEDDASEPLGFEEALTRLGALVASLESGGLGLTESIAAYERGVALLRRLHEELDEAEERVKVLVRIDDEGRPVVADHEAAADPPEGATRSRGRSRGRTGRTRPLPGMDEASGEA